MVAIGAGAITYGFNYPFLTHHTARAYLGFFSGISLAVFMQHKPVYKNNAVLICCAVFLSFFAFLWLFARSTVKSDLYFLLVFTVFPCVLILFRSSLLQRLFSQRFWVPLGGIAFNTYMWHADVIIIMNLVRVLVPTELYYTRLSMILFAAVCFALGTLSYYFLDKPISALIRKNWL